MVTGPGPAVLSRAGLDELIAALIADGYRVIGPVAPMATDMAANSDSTFTNSQGPARPISPPG